MTLQNLYSFVPHCGICLKTKIQKDRKKIIMSEGFCCSLKKKVIVFFFLNSCFVEHKCHRLSPDLISSTCVVKPDYHSRASDGLGISHSVTHRCSSDTAHVHTIRTERERENERGGWEEEEVIERRKQVQEERDGFVREDKNR